MYKKKEIIFVVLIIALTIFLAYLPMINKKSETEVKTEDEIKYINIEVKGEIIVYNEGLGDDSITNIILLQMPVGTTYGEIILKIEGFLTKYSVIEENFKKRYYENSTIVIESSYVHIKEDDIEDEKTEDKIKISIASKSELMSLYGIGEVRADRIIDYRSKNEIKSFEELKILLGVSDAIIEAIKEEAIL